MRTQLEKSLHISCYLFHSGIPPCLKHMRSNFISFFQSFSRNWDSVTSNYRKANRIKQNRTFVDTVTEKSRKYIFLLEWCANDGVMNSCISSSRSSPLLSLPHSTFLPLFCWAFPPYGVLSELGGRTEVLGEHWAWILATDCPFPLSF